MRQPFDLVQTATGRTTFRAAGVPAMTIVAAMLVAAATIPTRVAEAQSLMDLFAEEGETDPEKIFAIIDKDGDGKITRAEFTERKMEVFFQKDVNRDTRLSREEFSSIGQAEFDEADLDGDGKLSTFEFDQAPFANFEALDANGDGVITLEEFLSFRQQMQ